MAEVKHVKVDNWGVFFLQRLKTFFNGTDYCDLTLQFRDYAQLKVHRLVLSACTKYFELLERTCEMYDNCLIMPDDLQADVVVPIVNFMYTGQLEYDYRLFDRLYSTAQIMEMTVLTKLLDAQKVNPPERVELHHRKDVIIMNDRINKYVKASSKIEHKSFGKEGITPGRKYGPGPGVKEYSKHSSVMETEAARPTRYELPEGLEGDELFGESFADISYESSPIVKPRKRERSPEIPPPHIYDEGSSSRKFEELKRTLSAKVPRISLEIPESKHFDYDHSNDYPYQSKTLSETHSDDDNTDSLHSMNDYQKPSSTSYQKENTEAAFSSIGKFNVLPSKDSSKSDSSNISVNHAKIISEVLKKYPHLVKSNKNIKLKIMSDKESNSHQSYVIEPNKKSFSASMQSCIKQEDESAYDWVYVPRAPNIDGMANLIALGAENRTGPWLCLICGTPSKALKFVTYHKYYRHLIDHHKEKVPPKICEYCGFKSGKRNHLLHHMYTKHDISPPANYHFPKCNLCPYIALTEAFLIKHKLTHADSKDFTCSVCNCSFKTRPQLLTHIQISGHKVCPDRKISTKCVYCSKVFLREANLYTHLKVSHKAQAKNDGIIENSDEDEDDGKYEQNVIPYNLNRQQIKQDRNGRIQIISNTQINKPHMKNKQKLLNTDLSENVTERVKDHSTPAKQYSKSDQSISNQGVKVDTLGSVARSISSSINLVDVVVLNENEFMLQNEEITTNQPIKAEPIERRQSIELPITNLQMSDNSESNTIVTKQPVKVSQSMHNVQKSQPVQIVVSGNQQYKAIVSSSPIVYTNSGRSAIVSDENRLENEVMVLNENDFQLEQTLPIQIECSQPISKDSKIVFVYNNDDTNDKQFLQIADQQYESESQEMENSQSEEREEIPAVSDNALVQETIESWQEVTIMDESKDVNEEFSNDLNMPDNQAEKSNDSTIPDNDEGTHENEMDMDRPCENVSEVLVETEELENTDQNVETEDGQSMEIDENVSTDVMDNLVQDMEIEENPQNLDIEVMPQNNETVSQDEEIVSQDEEVISHEEEAVSSNHETLTHDIVVTSHIEEIISENDEIEHSNSEQSNENAETEDLFINETGEVTENKELHDESEKNKEDEHLNQNNEEQIEDNAKMNEDWFNKDENSEDVHNSSYAVNNQSNTDQPLEIEESIENIQEEIEKQTQEEMCENHQMKELLCDSTSSEKEQTKMDKSSENNDDELETADKIIENNNEKAKNVEKISSLLNEWEDNDSQLEEIAEVDSKESSHTDSKIDKLVSDWDDEDDK